MRRLYVAVHLANVLLGTIACYHMVLRTPSCSVLVWAAYGFLVLLPFEFWRASRVKQDD